MKLRAICTSCSRELILDEALDAGPVQGLCPWCGTTLAPQYTSLLIDETGRIEQAMDELLSALQGLLRMPRHFRLVPEDFIRRVHEELGVSAELIADPAAAGPSQAA
jgi:hypothetical protein